MLEQGIYLAPSAFEAWFVSTAHDPGSIQKTIQCAERSFASLKREKNSLTFLKYVWYIETPIRKVARQRRQALIIHHG